MLECSSSLEHKLLLTAMTLRSMSVHKCCTAIFLVPIFFFFFTNIFYAGIVPSAQCECDVLQ